MAKARKPSDRQIMDALSRKVKTITAGESVPRGQGAKMPKPSTSKAAMLDVSLKRAIRQSGRSYYDLGRAAGVAPSVILRFMSDDPQARGGDMRLSTAAKLAAELGFELVYRR
jgi:hypothetical protein